MKTVVKPYGLIGIFLLGALVLDGCSSLRKTVFINPEFSFGSVERIAIVPFENLSTDQGVGDYVTRLFMTELLAARVFDIVEPGEVSKYLATKGIAKTGEETVEQIADMGKTLGIQAIIFGTVGESTQYRSGGQTLHVISLNARMVSTETGATVWSAVVNTGSPGFLSRILGLGDRSRSDAVRAVVRKATATLVD